MNIVSTAVGIISMILEAGILLRAWRGRFLSKFPFFYSYMAYVLGWSLVTFPLYFLLAPMKYASIYWFFYLLMTTAEFAVIAEASHHIFSAYPLVRRMGQLVTWSVCLVCFVVYILPPLQLQQPSRATLLELYQRLSVTQGLLIFALLFTAKSYGLEMGRNVSGLMVGFSTYLSLNLVNATLAKAFGWAVYFKVYTLLEPIAFVLALSIWLVALWRYEPVLPGDQAVRHNVGSGSGSPGAKLDEYDAELSRLLKR